MPPAAGSSPSRYLSLRMLDAAGVTAAGSLIDVGGGASSLAAALLERGFSDLTVLDISAAGMEYARRRLGPRVREVNWVTADIRTWVPPRRFAAWHDRAVFHFLTDVQDQRAYLRTLATATAASAVAVFGCFAPDGRPGAPACRWPATPRLTSRHFSDLTGSRSPKTAKPTSPRPARPSPTPGLPSAAPASLPPRPSHMKPRIHRAERSGTQVSPYSPYPPHDLAVPHLLTFLDSYMPYWLFSQHVRGPGRAAPAADPGPAA